MSDYAIDIDPNSYEELQDLYEIIGYPDDSVPNG